MALDGRGNVHVTGYADGPERTGLDYVTVKYDAGGSELWAVRYDGPAHRGECAKDIAVDAAGNVYVTGSSGVSEAYSEYATVKYDAAGEEVWAARYLGAGGHDSASALAVDAAENVHVTGTSYGRGSGMDYATVKYDAVGNRLWVARYDGPAGAHDCAAAIALGPRGEVFVTGASARTGRGSYDFATLKYDADGNLLWASRRDGPGGWNDFADVLALGAGGRLYVTGQAFLPGPSGTMSIGSELLSIAYDAEGTELWSRSLPGPNVTRGARLLVAARADGALALAGTSAGSGGVDDILTLMLADRVPAPAEADFLRGDANGDLRLAITDVLVTLNYLFLDGAPPACLDAADADDSGRLNITDPAAMLGWLFLESAPLPPPLEAPGPDPTPDALVCPAHGV
jgi:hypothetical protein